jgi:hypothetical protein
MFIGRAALTTNEVFPGIAADWHQARDGMAAVSDLDRFPAATSLRYLLACCRSSRTPITFVGGCSSWYRDRFGKITTMWPGFTFRFRQRTRTFDLNAYHAVHARDLSAADTFAASG